MNKTFSALLIKFIATFLVTWISFNLFAYSSFAYILIVSIAVTLFGYLGDKLLLGRFGNISASISDGVFSVVVAYFVALVIGGLLASYLSFIVYAILSVVSEYFFHRYLMNNEEEVDGIRRAPSYNMETSEEFDARDTEENEMIMQASDEFDIETVEEASDRYKDE